MYRPQAMELVAAAHTRIRGYMLVPREDGIASLSYIYVAIKA